MVIEKTKSLERALWTCLYILLTTTGKVIPQQTTYQLISGLQMERVPSPSAHFYKEYVPLIYQISVPRWNKSNTVIFGSQNCSTTNYTKFFTTCPVLYYLTDIHDRFSEYFASNQPLVVNLEDINAKPETALVSFDCELIQSHFEDIFMDKVTVEEYLARLKSCSLLGSHEYIQGLTNYVYNISGIYQEMRRSFYNEFWLKIDLIDGRVDAAIWANAISTLNSLLFQNYMIEANRWKTATIDCEAGRIPSSILPPSLLGDTLAEVLELLSSKKVLPTVSTDSVGNYYKSSLTDCTFTNSDTLLVRILIPVIPQEEKFLLVKIAPIPFYYYEVKSKTDWQCEIDPEVLPKLKESEDIYVLVDLMRNVAYESDCKPGKLCHIPTAMHPRRISPCATAAFNWERLKGNKNDSLFEDLINFCPIKCIPVHKFKAESFKHIAPSQYLWFVGGNSRVRKFATIDCTSSSHPSAAGYKIKVLPPSYGSQKFEISCDCSVQLGNGVPNSPKQVFNPKPCNGLRPYKDQNLVQVAQLAPVQWYSPNLLIKNGVKEFWNVSRKVFENPGVKLIRESLKLGNEYGTAKAFREDSASSSSNGSNYFTVFLSLVSLGMVIMVVFLAWRLHSLIKQLEGMGFNVKSSYNIGGGSSGNGNGEHQVSYRNMGALVDTDSLIINEGQ